MVESGAAKALGDDLTSLLSTGGDFTIVFGIFFATSLLASVISPVASVAIMFPIARQAVGAATYANFDDIVYVLMVAASCSFLTPFAYQTNLLVAEAGGYAVGDFVKLGAPVLLIVALVSCSLALFAFWGTSLIDPDDHKHPKPPVNATMLW